MVPVEMTSRTVAITGANGFVGGRILALLSARGDPVVGIVREGRTLVDPSLPKRDVAGWSTDVLTQALQGVKGVVHAASVVHRPGASPSEHEAFNVQGTRALIVAARAAGVRRIVFLSTIKVYGEEPTGLIDESTPVDRSSSYSSTKLDAERILLEATDEQGPSVAVLRLCPVYGAGDKGNVRRVVTAIARRRFAVPGDGTTRKSIVHVSTVAEVVARALQSNVSGVFVLSDRIAPSMRELSDTIARALGRRRPPSVPVPLALGIAGGLAAIAQLRGRETSVSPEIIRKSLRSTICSPAKLEQTFGVDCHVDLRDGLAEEIAWLRDEGLV
jgi:nucleoside-diphosphate-sugar epimerase